MRKQNMFKVGSEYTRDEIHGQLGGSKVAYLPMLEGRVVAVCVKRDLNPRAPNVVLCGKGRDIEKSGYALSRQREALPVFVKLDINRWEYQGLYRVAAVHTSGPDFDSLVTDSGRAPSDVTLAIELKAEDRRA